MPVLMPNATTGTIITMVMAKPSMVRVHIDFLGPFMGHMFLLLIDAHSKWIEVYPMASITAKASIECLRNVFA